MDDKQRDFKVTIGGQEYAAAPLSQGQLISAQLIKKVPAESQLHLISGLFRGSLGDDAHTELVLRLSYDELSMTDWIEALTAIAALSTAAEETDDVPLPADGGE